MQAPHKTAEAITVCMDKLSAALEIIPSAAVVMSQDGKLIGANDKCLLTFGYSLQELIGKEVEMLVPERYRGKHVHHRGSYFKAPDNREMGVGRDLTGLRKDGTEFPIEIGLRPLQNDAGEMMVLATVVDITERRSLEELVRRQQQDLMELSTPVIRLWEGIVVLPIVGTLDSERSHCMVQQLLQALSESESVIAIVDISGVPTVDTLVAQHLMKAIDASRLLGTECIISGIRPEIANTIVNLGLDLSKVKTKSTLARALRDAFTTLNLKVVPM